MGKLRLAAIQLFVRGHTTYTCKAMTMYPGSLVPEHMLQPRCALPLECTLPRWCLIEGPAFEEVKLGDLILSIL